MVTENRWKNIKKKHGKTIKKAAQTIKNIEKQKMSQGGHGKPWIKKCEKNDPGLCTQYVACLLLRPLGLQKQPLQNGKHGQKENEHLYTLQKM